MCMSNGSVHACCISYHLPLFLVSSTTPSSSTTRRIGIQNRIALHTVVIDMSEAIPLNSDAQRQPRQTYMSPLKDVNGAGDCRSWARAAAPGLPYTANHASPPHHGCPGRTGQVPAAQQKKTERSEEIEQCPSAVHFLAQFMKTSSAIRASKRHPRTHAHKCT